MPVPVLHVCCGDSAADLVRDALGLPEAAVLTLREDLAVGPLGDVDAGSDQRAAFWAEAMPDDQRRAIEAAGPLIDQLTAEAARLRHLPRAAARIVIWHGTGAGEQLMLRRAMWALRDATVPVEEIAVDAAALDRPARGALTAVAMLAPERVPDIAATARPVAPDRRARLAAEWERLRSDGSGLRHVAGDTVTGHPIDTHDAEILAAIDADWQPGARAVGRAMGEIDAFFITDSFVFWRLRRLAAQGRVEFAEEPSAIRGSRVRRTS